MFKALIGGITSESSYSITDSRGVELNSLYSNYNTVDSTKSLDMEGHYIIAVNVDSIILSSGDVTLMIK